MSAPIPIPGNPVYLGSFMGNIHVFGVVGDGRTPAMQVATIESVKGNAVIALDVLKGPQGEKGTLVDPIKMQYDLGVENVGDLPSNLLPADKGKTWWIGNQVQHWTGDRYIARPMGSQGAPGPIPDITFVFQQVGPDESPSITQTGTVARPVVLIKVAPPRGPAGPAGYISLAEDLLGVPADGQVPMWSESDNKWVPTYPTLKSPQLFSFPSSAFSAFTGTAQRHTVLNASIPALPWDWTPMVSGHIKAVGVALSSDPFKVGAEVRMGDAITGQLIGRGHGNLSTLATIMPHYSTGTDTATAVAPGNGVAVVPAHTKMDVHVNLFNDGLFGSFDFDPATGPHLSVLAVPTE